MARHRYFAHTAGIAATGWMRGRNACPSVSAWRGVAGPVRRRNILHRCFHTIAIGVASGTPIAAGGKGATSTTHFGS
jgi:hypothetical protein